MNILKKDKLPNRKYVFTSLHPRLGNPRISRSENKIFYFLILIFVLALFLRIYKLGSIPVGFHNDEVDTAYVGKFLILNGKDPAGNFLPLSFNKFGDFRPTGLFYLTGIAEMIFGTNEFAARFPSALFGALTVFPLFFLSLAIFKKKEIALVSSLFLAILSWHIALSRAGHEAIVGYFLIIYGLYFLLKFKETTSKNFPVLRLPAKALATAGFLFLVSSYLLYHGTRTLVPILLLGFLLIWCDKNLARFIILLSIISALIILSPVGRGRLSQVVFYKNPDIVQKLKELPYADTNPTVARIFHNKAVVYSRELATSYLQHFSPSFLFLSGGYPERYAVPQTGVIYIIFAPFLLLAAFAYLRAPKLFILPLFWLLTSPIGAVLTYEDIPSVTRASFMIFPLVLIAAYGFGVIFAFKKLLRNILISIFALALFAEFAYFNHQYFIHQKGYKGILRDQGAREIATYMKDHQSEYDLVLAQYGPNFPFYYLFFANIFDKNIKFDISNLSENFQYKNVLFTRDGCPSHRADQFVGKKVLYVDMADCEIKPKTQVLLFVMRQDSTVAYRAEIRDLQ